MSTSKRRPGSPRRRRSSIRPGCTSRCKSPILEGPWRKTQGQFELIPSPRQLSPRPSSRNSHSLRSSAQRAVIVTIRGQPGAGKTWLCKRLTKLPHVVCYDTDDIVDQARANTNTPEPRGIEREINHILGEIKQRDADKVIVFAGVTINVRGACRSYFIKTDLPTSYRRLFLRELGRVVKSHHAMKIAIEKEPVINIKMEMGAAAGISWFFPDWPDYVKDYRLAAKTAQEKYNARVRTQDEILQEIALLGSRQ